MTTAVRLQTGDIQELEKRCGYDDWGCAKAEKIN